MKFLIAFTLLAVVSALPPRHGFHHQQQEDYQVDGPIYLNRYHQIDLIKLMYQKLIDRLNHPPQDDNEEEERAINNIVDTINVIGHILNDDGDDNNDYSGPPKPQHPEHKSQGVIPYKPSKSNNEISSYMQEEEIIPSHDDSEVELISIDEESPESDENESDKLSLVDSILKDDGSEHGVFVNQKDDEENPRIDYNSVNVVNEASSL